MTVKLPRNVAKMVRERLDAGGYRSAEEVIQSAMGALEQAEQFRDFAPGELDKLIEEGERSIRKHGTLSVEEAVGISLSKLRKRRRRTA